MFISRFRCYYLYRDSMTKLCFRYNSFCINKDCAVFFTREELFLSTSISLLFILVRKQKISSPITT